MACCTKALSSHASVQNKSITLSRNSTCADWCFSAPKKCSGYTFNEKESTDRKCMMCLSSIDTDTDVNNCGNSKIVQTLRPPCYNNVCVAVDSESVNIIHGTTLYISQEPYLYVPYTGVATQFGNINIEMKVPYPTNVRIVGPGTITGDLPLKFGKNVSIEEDVNFEQCASYKVAQAAILLNQGGLVNIFGRVLPHFAKSFVVVAPLSPIGNTVDIAPNSIIHYTGSSANAERVCAAAFSHVVGSVAVQCANKCFTVTQDLAGSAKLLLEENSSSHALNVNLSSLLNDFGSEYLIEYADGPTNNKATAATLTGIMFVVTITLLILTLIFHQRYFKFV